MLSQLSLDVLRSFGSLVDGSDVFRLVMCGNRALTAKIVYAVRSLDFEVLPFSRFPFSAYALPLLESLSVTTSLGPISMPLRLFHQLPMPTEPKLPLTSLILRFAQSFRVLALENGSPLLEKWFPSLQLLCLEEGQQRLSEEHIRALPRTLTSLVLRSPNVSPLALLQSTDLQHLPHGLTSLDLRSITVKASDSGRYQVPWPTGIKRLAGCIFTSPHILHHLPLHVEYLDIEVKADPSGWTTMPSIGLLPQSLTYCRIQRYLHCEPFHFILDAPIPPNLTFLDIRWQPELSNEQVLPLLPPRLKNCPSRTAIILAATGDYKYLSHLEELGISNTDLRVLPVKVPLPPHLKTLHANIPSEHIPWSNLPSTLTKVSLRVTSTNKMKSIPRGVKTLHLLDDPYLHRHPPDLRLSVYLMVDAFDAMPPTLTSLMMDLHLLDNVECLRHLPLTLIDLELSVSDRTLLAEGQPESLQ